MKKAKEVKFLLSIVLLGIFSGCATYPISGSLRNIARRDISFSMVQSNPAAYVGSIVIWGGFIIETSNLAGGSEMLILETPLRSDEVPIPSTYTQGRFIAKASGFLDPVIYSSGRRVTIAGEITGSEMRKIGETEYSYPVINIKELYIWGERLYYEPYYYEPHYYPYPGPHIFIEGRFDRRHHFRH